MGKAFRYQYDAGAAMETDLSGSFFLRVVKKRR
jgi:hypothetical protein